MIIKILACIIMIAIAYQDFKYRAIYWALFLLLSAFFIIDGLKATGSIRYAHDVVTNILLILLQFLMLYIFYLLRGKNYRSIINNVIGIGDILFILIMSLAFSWQSFLFYYICGLVFSITLWILLKHSIGIKGNLVPFAGLMAIYCSILLIIELWAPVYGRFNDGILKVLING